MLKSFVTPAIVALLLTGAASAQTVSSDAQLAAAAGVPAGQYTAAELQVIERARNDNDAATLNFYLSGENRTAAGNVTDAGGQLAKLAGVADGSYSPAELVNILNARSDNDAIRLAYYLSGQDRVAPPSASAVTRGETQLATSLGVDPAQYTLAELAVMARKADQSQ